MLGSGFLEFKIDYSEAKIKNLPIGAAIYSPNFAAGGYLWRIRCYPRGTVQDGRGDYLSLFLELVTQASTSVTAVFEAFLLRGDGAASIAREKRLVRAFPPEGFCAWGWSHFAPRRALELESSSSPSPSPDLLPADSGRVTFVCGVIVLRDAGAVPTPTPAPPSDVATSLGRLLDSGDGSDVAFAVSGETFRAHRAVLAARSPVLMAALLGSMAEATTPTVTLRDIEPETFGAMLRFMYTDTLPTELDGDGEDSPSANFFLELLTAADRYAVDMLKVVCAQRLRDMLSVDSVGAILMCAEMHGCPELKNKCLEFFVDDKNFKKVVLTEGYLQLIQSLPSLVDEIKARIEEKEKGTLQDKGSRYVDFGVFKARYLDPLIKMLVAALNEQS